MTDISGKTLTNSTVVGRHNKSKHGRPCWVVKCRTCGREHLRTTNEALQDRKCRNCGGRDPGDSGLAALYAQYKNDAQRRKHPQVFTLTLEEFKRLTTGDCFYCGQKPNRKITPRKYRSGGTWGDYLCNGIDRKDNSVGYISDNCLSCCRDCNYAKRDMTFEEFATYLERIAKRFKAIENIVKGVGQDARDQ